MASLLALLVFPSAARLRASCCKSMLDMLDHLSVVRLLVDVIITDRAYTQLRELQFYPSGSMILTSSWSLGVGVDVQLGKCSILSERCFRSRRSDRIYIKISKLILHANM